MSTIEVPLYGPGWDQFAYPVQGVRPVAEALQSIEGMFNTVYWYDASNTSDSWKVFSTEVPTWVNDLTSLQFGERYWIHLTSSIILKLHGARLLEDPQTPAQLIPPATFYGPVLASDTFTPTVGMEVLAWTNNVICGQGTTQLVDGQVVYSVNVSADDQHTPGCGKEGDRVTFQIGSYKMATGAWWNSDKVWYVSLSTRTTLYIPIVTR